MRRAVSSGTHIYSAKPLRQRLEDELGDVTFEELPVPFEVCAASIERAAEHWFTTGRVVDAVVASAAVPGLLPPAKVGDEHYLDGGIVNSIPLGRAVRSGADRGLRAPGRPDRPAAHAAQAAVGGRPGLLRDRPPAPLPARAGRAARHVECHVLPARGTSEPRRHLAGHADFGSVQERIDATYDAAGLPGEHL